MLILYNKKPEKSTKTRGLKKNKKILKNVLTYYSKSSILILVREMGV